MKDYSRILENHIKKELKEKGLIPYRPFEIVKDWACCYVAPPNSEDSFFVEWTVILNDVTKEMTIESNYSA